MKVKLKNASPYLSRGDEILMCPAGETVTLVSLLSTVVPTKKRRFVHSVIEKKQQLNKFFFGPVKVRTRLPCCFTEDFIELNSAFSQTAEHEEGEAPLVSDSETRNISFRCDFKIKSHDAVC